MRVTLPDRPAARLVAAPPPTQPSVHIGVVEVRIVAPAPAPVAAPAPPTRTVAAPATRISRPASQFGLAQG